MICDIIVGIYIGIAAVADIRTKSISLLQLLMGVVVVAITRWLGDISLAECCIGGGIGLLILLLAVCMRGKVGIGDGLFLVNLGLMRGGSAIVRILIWACLLMSLFCLIGLLIKKLGMRSKIPFLPFLLIGYIAVLIEEAGIFISA